MCLFDCKQLLIFAADSGRSRLLEAPLQIIFFQDT